MKTKKTNRLLAIFICLCMVVGLLPVSVFAVEPQSCPNHTAHDAACGYVEAVEGHACGHTHDEACGYAEAKEGTLCKHERGEHDERCGYQEGAGEIPCDKECSEAGEDGTIVHAEGCAYTPAVEGVSCSHQKHDGSCGYAEAVVGAACQHKHDTACGYVEAVEGHVCGHTCELCNGTEKVVLFEEIQTATYLISGQVTYQSLYEKIILSGITVTLWQDGAQVNSTTTDQEGKYTFAALNPGKYEVKAGGQASDGLYYAEDSWSVTISDRDAIDWDFNLNPGNASDTYSISGRVQKAGTTDDLIIGVTLWQGDQKIGEALTDIMGKYSFTSLAPGTYTVKTGGRASDGVYYIEQSQTVTIGESNPEGSCSFSLEPGNAPGTYSISGSVRKAVSQDMGDPLIIGVTLWKDSEQVGAVNTIAPFGKYTFTSLAPGTYTVKAGGWSGGVYYAEQSQTVTIGETNPEESCLFRLEPGRVPGTYLVSGSVILPGISYATPDIPVELWHDGQKITSTVTFLDSSIISSEFELFAEPGNYTLRIPAGTYAGTYCLEYRTSVVVGSQDTNVPIELKPGTAPTSYTVSGKVLNSAGSGLQGIPVQLLNADIKVSETTTGVNGDYTITQVNDGEYTLKVPDGTYGGTVYQAATKAITVNGQNVSAANLTLTAATTAPTAPVNFTVTPGHQQAVLSWTAPNDDGGSSVIKYQYSAAANGAENWQDIPGSNASTTSYTVTGLTGGTKYTFKVRAVNGVGAGAAATATATPTVPGPSAPQNFNTTYANTILNLYWKAPASDGGLPIVKYQYSIAEEGAPDDWRDIPNSNASTTSYTVTGLTNFTTYTVKLRAVNSTSVGEAVSDTFYLEPSSPGAVRNLTAIPGDGQMTLNWEKPENDGGSPITHYQYRYNADPTSSGAANQWSRIPDSGPNTVSFTITGLENGVELAFWVRAYSAYGMGDRAMVMATPQAASTVPTAPQNFKATPGDRQVALSWEVPASNGGAEITGYEVSKDNGTSWVDATSATGHTFDNLTNGQSYTFQVRAVNSAGKGTAASKTATPQAAATVPGAPQNFTATPGDRQVVLAWEAPARDGGAEITGYEVSSDGGTTWADATSATGHTFANLTNGQSYTFQVRAVNSAGKGTAATATATPQAAPTVPGAPRNFTATPGDRQVALSWEAPASNGGATITKYEVSSNGGTNWTDATSATGHTFDNLTNGQSYTFQVRAVNSAGKGTAATATATPQAAPTVPGAPRNFTATPSDRQVVLSWEAPASNGGAAITKYEVSKDSGTTWVDATSATGHTFENLTNGQSYSFQVRAVNSAGKGAAATATATPQAAPTAPRNFTATPGDRQVALSWEAPASNGGAAITKYEVSKDSGTSWTNATSATGHTFANLTNGQSYTFQVRAINSAGKGAAASKTATPQAAAPNLIGITAPDAITGVANGTLLSNISLPDYVAITTTQGGKQATVIWNRGQQTPTYDPTSKAAQTFTVSGTVTLPVSVTNTGNIPLSVQISVTVAAEDADAITGVQIVNKPGKLSYTEGDALDLSGLTVKLNFSKSGEKTVGLSECAANHITVSPANGAKLSRGDTTVTVSAGGKSAGFDITVSAKRPEATPTVAIDYGAEQLTGFAANGSYTIGGAAVTPVNGKLTIEAGWFGRTLSIVKKGGASTLDSAPQQLPVPARPAAPSPGKTDETSAEAGDGSITGVSGAMEYRLSTAAAWTAITGTAVQNLAPGTYEVRLKATGSAFASLTARVVIAAGASVTGVTVSPASPSVQKGTTQTFTASVSGMGNPSQAVNWSVSGNNSPDTKFTGNVLTVAADETAATLTVTATSALDNTKRGSATVTVTDTPPAPDYRISAAPGTLDFGMLQEGYTQPAARIVTVSNIGNRDLNLSAPTCSGTDYELGSLSTTALPAGGSATFTVRPKAGLAVGGHSATITIGAGHSAGDTVTVRFTVEAATSAPTYTVTFDPNGGSVSQRTATTGADGRLPSLPTPSRSSYTFTGWYTAASGGARITTDTVFAKDATVYAHWDYNSSGGGGGGGGGNSDDSGSDDKTTEKPEQNETNPPTEGAVKPAGKVDPSGKLEVTVTEKDVKDAIARATAQAKRDGNQANGIAVAIDLTGIKTGFDQLPLTLSKEIYKALVDAGVKSLDIRTSQISLSLDLATLGTIYGGATGDVTIRAEKADASKLPADTQKALGGRPLYDLTIVSGGKTISAFGGYVSIALPYTRKEGEQGGNLQLAYVGADGKLNYITDSSYDANAKALIGRTAHFTVFGVVEKQIPDFADIGGHWAKDDILFVASRGLLGGIGDKVFSPNSSMTRGMFVTALGRLAGIDPAGYKTGKFTDVAADAYYAPYVNWAASKGIVSGTTTTTFTPDQPVTRQQMAVIMQNYAKAMGYTVPVTREAAAFTDESAIAGWAKDAVKAMQMAGILNGKDGNRFDPKGTATRAEVAAVLHRYVELVIDPATAQGLDTNDSGSAMMYEGGKPVKSASRTVGGSTYVFNRHGEAALPVKKQKQYVVQSGDSFWRIANKLGCTMAELERWSGKSRYSLIHPGEVLIVPEQ